MLLKDLLQGLKNTAERLIEWSGWNIAFYIKEEKEDYFVLSIKEHLIEQAITFLEKRRHKMIWDLHPFKEIYEQRLEISNLIKNEISVTNSISFYDEKLVNDIQKRLRDVSELNEIYNYFQNINFSFVDAISIHNFFAIKSIALTNIKGRKEVYFLGENGDGKSLILMGIYLAFNNRYIERFTERKFTGEVYDMVFQNLRLNLKLKAKDVNGLIYGDYKGVYLMNFFAYGVHRGRYDTDNAEQYGFMSLFGKDWQLNNPITWLTREYSKELQNEYNKKNKVEEKNSVGVIPTKVLIDLFQELLEKNVEIEINVEQVKFKEKGYDLTFEQLSEGYKNLIIWVCDLIYRLHKNQPGVEKLNELMGVVMVDEIELHLHPKWQRTLVSKLRNFFPNIQFIFTTHSPTIIQGASDEAIIYKVYRDNETGHTHVSEPY